MRRAWALVVLAALLATPWQASAAPPDLTGKELAINERPDGPTHIVIKSGGKPGSDNVVAFIRNPSSSEIKLCKNGDFSMAGSYSTAGDLKLKTNWQSCRPWVHEIEMNVSSSGKLSGKWGAGAVWGDGWHTTTGYCVNCGPGDTDWTTPMIVAAIAALIGWLAYRGKQIEKAKAAASAPTARGAAPPVKAEDGPSFDGVELTEAGARQRRLEEERRQAADEAARRKREQEAAARRAAEEARNRAALEEKRKKEGAEAAKRKTVAEFERRKVAKEAEKQAETRRALEAEGERLHKQVAKSAGDLLSRVTDPKRRAFYEAFLKRHEGDPEKLRLAIKAVAKQMEGEGDPAAKEAEWLGKMEKHAESIRDWSMRANRMLSWVVPGSSAILAAQGALAGAIAGAEEGGIAGAGKHFVRMGADMASGGIATQLYDANGNIIKVAKDRLKAYDPREYEKRLRAARKKFDEGQWSDAAGDAIDAALDVADSGADARNSMRGGARGQGGATMSSAGGVPLVVGAVGEKKKRKKQDPESSSQVVPLEFDRAKVAAAEAEVEALRRKDAERQRRMREEAPAKRAADEKKWQEKSRSLAGVAVGNEFEKGFHGWDRDKPHVWVEDLDRTFKESLNPLGHTDMAGARSPLIDKRLFHGESAGDPRNPNRNRAGYASVAASNAASGADYYEGKFKKLLTKPFTNDTATQKLLRFLGHQDEPAIFVDRSSIWVPSADQAKARQAAGRLLFKDGAYDFSPVQDYVDHLRHTRPDLRTDAAIARELLGKIQGRTPWAL